MNERYEVYPATQPIAVAETLEQAAAKARGPAPFYFLRDSVTGVVWTVQPQQEEVND